MRPFLAHVAHFSFHDALQVTSLGLFMVPLVVKDRRLYRDVYYVYYVLGAACVADAPPGSAMGRNENTDRVQDGAWGAAVCVRETQQSLVEQILKLDSSPRCFVAPKT